MFSKRHKGIAALPIIAGGVLLTGLIISLFWLMNNKPTPTSDNAPPMVENKPSASPAPAKSQIVWGSINPGVYDRQVAARSTVTETISLNGQGQTSFKITTRNPKLTVTLQDDRGQTIKAGGNDSITVVKQTVTNPQSKETTFVYQITTANNQTAINNWQLVINNQQTNSPSTYELTVSDNSLVNADPSDGSLTNTPNGQTASLSIIVQETIALNVVVPVVGATVVANVTDPNQNTETVTLTESQTAPGTYTGSFTNVDEPGTYQVEYIISGENAAGEHFDQIVTDSFTVPDPNIQPADPNSTFYQSNKKFDINQGSEIRPVY